MPKAVVLGAGMVGSVLAADLAATRGWRVTVADRSPESLARATERAARGGVRLAVAEADLGSGAAIAPLLGKADVVVGALPSHLGFQALKTVVEAGLPYADLSFMPEDPLELSALAKRRGATALVDFGVAPGMSNLLAGWAAERLAPCERIAIYVGGLPVERRLPFQYKAAFSPADVLEEYTRPVRLVEGGREVVREPLSEPEPIEVRGIGTLEAFNTDGLRTLVRTLRVPFMKEKTLRYPGHAALMDALRVAGFLGTEAVEVGAGTVRPRDLAAALLFPMWSYTPGEPDLTAMRIVAEGIAAGRPARLVFDLLDRYDAVSDTTSMARTTAYPCAIGARLLAAGRVGRAGVIPPELLAKEKGVVDHVLKELARRGVRYETSIEQD